MHIADFFNTSFIAHICAVVDSVNQSVRLAQFCNLHRQKILQNFLLNCLLPIILYVSKPVYVLPDFRKQLHLFLIYLDIYIQFPLNSLKQRLRTQKAVTKHIVSCLTLTTLFLCSCIKQSSARFPDTEMYRNMKVPRNTVFCL